jgi:hypothetical protein
MQSHIVTRFLSPVRFTYTISSSTLERVVSITDLDVILDRKQWFRNHIDATIAKGLAMLGFIKRLPSEFRDPYNLKVLYVSLVRSMLEYACCIWQPFSTLFISLESSGIKKSSLKTRCVDLDGTPVLICRLIEVVAR